jgi:hypothetical protein
MEATSYSELDKLLTGQCKQSRKLANHTYAERRGDDSIAIRLHATDIVTFSKTGTIRLNSGGWRTVTTMERMNRYLPMPYRVRTIKRIWYLSTGGWDRNAMKAVFDDGCKITKGGKLVGFEKLAVIQAKLKEAKAIRDYAKSYVEALAKKEVPAPNAGDCWMCYLETKEGQSLGEISNDIDHLQSHIKENYFVGSLMMRAIKVHPISLMAKAYLSDLWNNNENQLCGSSLGKSMEEQLYKSLMRYLMRRLGFAG